MNDAQLPAVGVLYSLTGIGKSEYAFGALLFPIISLPRKKLKTSIWNTQKPALMDSELMPCINDGKSGRMLLKLNSMIVDFYPFTLPGLLLSPNKAENAEYLLMMSLNFFNLSLFRLCHFVQVPLHLQIQPEIRCHAKKAGQP